MCPFCVSLISGHPWSIYLWLAVLLDPKAAEEKWGREFVARSISKVARDAVSGATVPWAWLYPSLLASDLPGLSLPRLSGTPAVSWDSVREDPSSLHLAELP